MQHDCRETPQAALSGEKKKAGGQTRRRVVSQQNFIWHAGNGRAGRRASGEQSSSLIGSRDSQCATTTIGRMQKKELNETRLYLYKLSILAF